jgi:hypothetical protein
MDNVTKWSLGSFVLIASVPAMAQGTAASAPIPATPPSGVMPGQTTAVDPTWMVAGTMIGLAVGLAAGYALGKLSGLSMFVNNIVAREVAHRG